MALEIAIFIVNVVTITLAVDILVENGVPLSRKPSQSSALFMRNDNLRLIAPAGIHSATTEEESCISCGLKCTRLFWCFSFNCGINPIRKDGKRTCEALATDKYNYSSGNLQPSENFHHFSILSPCSAGPCQNGGSCIALYDTSQFKCICPAIFTGLTCERIGYISVYLKASGCEDPGIDGDCSRSVSSIQVNGVEYSPMKRGHNIVVVNSNGTVEERKHFDTHGDPGTAVNMKYFIDGIQQDSIVLIATQDSAESYANPAALKSVGARKASSLEYRGSWCLIGCKGASKPWIQESIRGRTKGPAVLTAKIPIT